jgi:acetamidase/formamidase
MTAGRAALHHLAGPHHFRFDNSLAPALEVRSGDIVVFETLEAYGGKLSKSSTVDELMALPWDAVHCLTGPVSVEGAEPGDVLEAEILAIEHDDWAWTGVFPGIGLLAEDFGDTSHLQIWTLDEDGRAPLGRTVRVPVEAFCGVVGVALREPGEHMTMPPRRVGGNIDTRRLVVGSSIRLPVEVPGAMFSIGDGHLAQGDGEVCGTALETNLTVTVRITLHQGRSIRAPQFSFPAGAQAKTEGSGYFATSSPGDSLRVAAQEALRDMLDLLEEDHGLSRVEAYVLCSAAADLRVSVPKLGDSHTGFVRVEMPRSIFTAA